MLADLIWSTLRNAGGKALGIWAALMVTTWLWYFFFQAKPLDKTELTGAGITYALMVIAGAFAIELRRKQPSKKKKRLQ